MEHRGGLNLAYDYMGEDSLHRTHDHPPHRQWQLIIPSRVLAGRGTELADLLNGRRGRRGGQCAQVVGVARARRDQRAQRSDPL